MLLTLLSKQQQATDEVAPGWACVCTRGAARL